MDKELAILILEQLKLLNVNLAEISNSLHIATEQYRKHYNPNAPVEDPHK